jgi:mannose-6-phosphate isomerase-like protein (cupin superfamily)
MGAVRVQKIWGREMILHNDTYCCKLLQYDGVRTSSKHYHEKKHETFVILKGLFEIDWYMLDSAPDGGTGRHGPGACLVFEPRTVHRVKCLSPDGGVIVEASSHDDPDDCVRLEPSVNPFG